MHAGNLGDVVLERAGRPLAAVQSDLDLEEGALPLTHRHGRLEHRLISPPPRAGARLNNGSSARALL
jgi:hypothetical protein